MSRETMPDTPMNYASSGVDIDAESAAVASLVGALSSSIRKKGDFGAPVPLPGGFGGIIEFGDYRLALATDGVGSKLMIANELQRYDGVGIDCVAMNVNDLLCVGAEPIAFVDYIAVPDKSNSVTIPGNVAVSPPAKVTLALLQASARDLPSIACVLVSVRGTAI